MIKHRVLSPDSFVSKFAGNEELLRGFAGLWPAGLDVDIGSLNVAAFRRFVEKGEGRSKDDFLHELHRVYDLCTPRGLEDLCAACRDSGYEPDPGGTLPVELLSLKVRTEKEEVFNLAYDRCTVRQAKRFSVYQGTKGLAIKNVGAARKRLHKALADAFQGDKYSDRVLVRQYQDDGYMNAAGAACLPTCLTLPSLGCLRTHAAARITGTRNSRERWRGPQLPRGAARKRAAGPCVPPCF